MENNPNRPPHNPASAPVTPPGPSALEQKPTPLPTAPTEGVQHPFPIPAGNAPRVPEEPKKHFWKSKLFLIVLLFLVILIPVSIFAASKLTSKPTPSASPSPAATPTPFPVDETASWKVYNDSDLGVTFKYPTSWTLKVNPEWKPITVFLEDNDFEFCTACEFMTSIQVSEDAGLNTTTNQKIYLNKTLTEAQKSLKDFYDPATLKTANMTVGGRDAVQISGTAGPGPFQGEQIIFTYIQMDGYLMLVALNNIEHRGIYDKILSNFKFTDSSTQNYLEIPEYGVKIALSESIRDAYYTPKAEGKFSWAELKVHSLDSEKDCQKNGLVALTRVGKDEVDVRTGKKFSDSASGTIIGNYYYYKEHSQAVCSSSNQTLEANARKAFGEAIITIL